MVNKRINKNCSTLFGLLLLLPIITVAGQQDTTAEQNSTQTGQTDITLPELIYETSEHFSDIDSANLEGLLERIGDSRLVLLGEATHGTVEFYDMRARITRELIENRGFNIVALEADWPDTSAIDYFIRGTGKKPVFKVRPFSGYPSWMWANHSVLAFTQWLKAYNESLTSAEDKVSFYGLDLYNLFSSIEAVLDYLREVDPKAAEVASWHYGCLMPWANDPAIYSRDMRSGRHRDCADEVSAVLQQLRKNRAWYSHAETETNRDYRRQRYFDALQNARLVINGERYYRTMFADSSDSWNQRDQNMFTTLLAILQHHGKTAKAVIWAHNSHIGDARATDMSSRGEFNLGQRVRETFGDDAYLIGFGTDHGSVAAATRWGAPMKVMQIPPSHKDSYEHLFHQVKAANFMLALRHPVKQIIREQLLAQRLQRAIGTMYDPEDELKKHYSYVSLPRQFDEYIWFDETHAVKPLTP